MTQPARATVLDNRLEYIDIGRCVAVVAVLLQHWVEEISPAFRHATQNVFSFGIFGVTLFFLISGYVIPPSIERGGLRKFWTSRFFRLYPLYWFALGCALITGYFLGNPDLSRFTPVRLAANFTMFQEYVRIPHLIGVSWTLSMEMLFYIACSVMFLLFDLKRWGYLLILAIIAGISLVALLNYIFLSSSLPLGRLITISSAFYGMHLYRNGWGGWKTWLLLGLAICAFFTCGVIRFELMPAPRSAEDPEFSAFCAIVSWAAAYLAFYVLHGMRAFTFPKPMLYVGTLCYSIYLMHPIVMCVLTRVTPGVGWLLANIVLVSLVSWFTYNCIERPALRWGKSLLSK